MEPLKESINTFNDWVSRARQEQALASYYEMSKTQDGQKQIMNDARTGDAVAADYLFLVYKKIIAKAFWQYYMGPAKQYHQKRLQGGADEDFASVAYNMLIGDEGTSPYKTFNPDKFTPTADLIKQFGYYVYRYLQNEAVKMIRSDKMGGIAGNIPKGEEVTSVGYEDHFDNTVQASDDSFEGAVDERITLKQFLIKLKNENKTYYQVFKGRMQQKSFNDIADELGISGQSVRNHLKKIQQMYIEFTE